jgi:hypothetical protein
MNLRDRISTDPPRALALLARVRGAKNQAELLYGISIDITERRALERRAADAGPSTPWPSSPSAWPTGRSRSTPRWVHLLGPRRQAPPGCRRAQATDEAPRRHRRVLRISAWAPAHRLLETARPRARSASRSISPRHRRRRREPSEAIAAHRVEPRAISPPIAWPAATSK